MAIFSIFTADCSTDLFVVLSCSVCEICTVLLPESPEWSWFDAYIVPVTTRPGPALVDLSHSLISAAQRQTSLSQSKSVPVPPSKRSSPLPTARLCHKILTERVTGYRRKPIFEKASWTILPISQDHCNSILGIVSCFWFCNQREPEHARRRGFWGPPMASAAHLGIPLKVVAEVLTLK